MLKAGTQGRHNSFNGICVSVLLSLYKQSLALPVSVALPVL